MLGKQKGCKFEDAWSAQSTGRVPKDWTVRTHQASSLPSQEAKSFKKSSKSTCIVLLRSALIPDALKTRTWSITDKRNCRLLRETAWVLQNSEKQRNWLQTGFHFLSSPEQRGTRELKWSSRFALCSWVCWAKCTKQNHHSQQNRVCNWNGINWESWKKELGWCALWQYADIYFTLVLLDTWQAPVFQLKLESLPHWLFFFQLRLIG